ncbi:hypothetical protein MSG28_007590, partial [Choristoneura fumiferana]
MVLYQTYGYIPLRIAICEMKTEAKPESKMEKIESALDVLSRAATMVQPCPAYPASDSDGF